MAQNGNKAGGKTVEVILKDDATVPDTTRRLAQELVVNDKVAVLAGFGITPSAMATAPIATQSKTPMVVMAAATSAITEASPFVVRTSFTLPQVVGEHRRMGDQEQHQEGRSRWSADYGPGIDAEKYFADRFTLNGGTGASRSCARRCAAPTSRPCCRRCATPSPTRCSSSCPRARARSS